MLPSYQIMLNAPLKRKPEAYASHKQRVMCFSFKNHLFFSKHARAVSFLKEAALAVCAAWLRIGNKNPCSCPFKRFAVSFLKEGNKQASTTRRILRVSSLVLRIQT